LTKIVKNPSQTRAGLLKRITILVGILALSRVGLYIPVSPKIDTDAFSEALGSSGSLLGYFDAISGSSVNKVGVFYLGIIPYINSSIIMQLVGSVSPQLKKMQMYEGPAGRQKFSLYQKILTVFIALFQAFGQLNYIRPFVTEFSLGWLCENSVALATGTIILTFLSNEIDKLKLGNGTSFLIFTNILSSLPTSLGSSIQYSLLEDPRSSLIFFSFFLITILGIVYVQEAERKIPINYANRYSETTIAYLGRTSYLPFKVNATGVMPIILASSLLALPATLSRYSDNEFIEKLAFSVGTQSNLYSPYNFGLIFLFNYFYTFIQFEPNEVADNLKKSGACVPTMRPGKTTALFLEGTLARMSLIGSTFLGLLALAPNVVEATTGKSTLRGFGGTSILILVGVATDLARKLRAEKLIEKYKSDSIFKL
jgi:preprotein translocase SecY subunit